MSNHPATAHDFVGFWTDLFRRSQKDSTLRERLIASPLEQLKAEGFTVDAPEVGKHIEDGVRAALDNPNTHDVLAFFVSGSPEGKAATDPNYLKAEAKLHGLVLTLSNRACNDLVNGMGIVSALSGVLSAIPAVGKPLALVISVGIGASSGIIRLQNKGKGVYITYLWFPPFPSWVSPVP